MDASKAAYMHLDINMMMPSCVHTYTVMFDRKRQENLHDRLQTQVLPAMLSRPICVLYNTSTSPMHAS
jgi:hypothetical protein